MEIIIVTGISGSGKSKAIETLEDMGYFCVDNLPPLLIGKLFELYSSANDEKKSLAVVIDARSVEVFGRLNALLDTIKISEIPFKILFLDADNKTILNRFKETRRKHPLISENITLEDAITMERTMVYELHENADYIIDTTSLSTAMLREKIYGFFSNGNNMGITINCVSFGFKNGIPMDTDLLFDVRCLPNPFYILDLKKYTGMEQCIVDFVMNSENSQVLMEKIISYLDFSIALYIEEGKTQLTISFGCTGGKHRSVTFARLVEKHLKEKGYNTFATHRDINKG